MDVDAPKGWLSEHSVALGELNCKQRIDYCVVCVDLPCKAWPVFAVGVNVKLVILYGGARFVVVAVGVGAAVEGGGIVNVVG